MVGNGCQIWHLMCISGEFDVQEKKTYKQKEFVNFILQPMYKKYTHP